MPGAPVRQKLGMLLGNKVVQKLKLEKDVFNKRRSLNYVFKGKKINKILSVFDT